MSIQELSSALVEATKSVLEGSKEYQAFFKSALKKFGVDSPAELGDKKKEFFNYVDKNYKGKNEEVDNVTEGLFMYEYEDEDEYRKGLEKPYVDAIKKGGGKNIKVHAPTSRDPQLSIEFKGGDIDKMRKLVDKVGDGTETIDEMVEGKLPPALQKAIDKKKEQEGAKKVDEWIKADGSRRRVAEKDQRKMKIEDVVRDMWQSADVNGLPTTLEGATTPVGKYQTPELREESLSEGMKKSKLKIDAKILKDLKKLEKEEKGMNDKEVKIIHDFFKKGVEVVSDDGEPAVISKSALKVLDKVWGKMDTFVRDEIYGIMKKHSDAQLSAVLGPYGA